MLNLPHPPKVLTIAGSDSGGSAGIQADLKTFTALGVFGSSALTVATAQNTIGIQAVQLLPLDFIRSQILTVLSDIGADVIKTGLLGRAEVVELVVELLPNVPLVVDPVLVNGKGQQIVSDDTLSTYKNHLFPHATIITPNLVEAQLLSGIGQLATPADFEIAARHLHSLGPQYVLIKGGQLPASNRVFDMFYDGHEMKTWQQPKLPIENPHGIGCTFASAIAAEIAKGNAVSDAVQIALQYVHKALAGAIAWRVGQGRSPVNHFAGLQVV